MSDSLERFQVSQYKEATPENHTPSVCVREIFEAKDFELLGEISDELKAAGFIEVGVAADLRAEGEKTNLFFSVQGVAPIDHPTYPFSAAAIQGDIRIVKIIDDIDLEDMPPWQSAMDGLLVGNDSIPEAEWSALEKLQNLAWEKVVASLVEFGDADDDVKILDDDRPLTYYLYT